MGNKVITVVVVYNFQAVPDTQLWPLIIKFFSLHHDLVDLIAQRESLFRAPLDFPRLKSYFQEIEIVLGRLKQTLQEIQRLAPQNSPLWNQIEEGWFRGTINEVYPLLKDLTDRNH